MPINELLLNGVNLMLIGMGMVFLFLTLLVFGMTLMSRITQGLNKGEHLEPSTPGGSTGAPSVDSDDELVAVIGAAVARYRARR